MLSLITDHLVHKKSEYFVPTRNERYMQIVLDCNAETKQSEGYDQCNHLM